MYANGRDTHPSFRMKRHRADVAVRSRKVHLINEHAIYKLICWWYLQAVGKNIRFFSVRDCTKILFLAFVFFPFKGQIIPCSHLEHIQFNRRIGWVLDECPTVFEVQILIRFMHFFSSFVSCENHFEWSTLLRNLCRNLCRLY